MDNRTIRITTENGKEVDAEVLDIFGVEGFDNDYKIQVEHGFSYIKKRYGSPDAAWQFHQKKGWY